MEVILLQKVENLGNLGDRVTVKPGYGRNYLIPKGKATEATAENMARFEARRAELEKIAADTVADAKSRSDRLTGMAVTIPAKAGNEGRLFGSVNVTDIATAITNSGVAVKKQEILLPDGPFRHVGEYEVKLRLHTDVEAQVRVNVVAEE
jgi:large subunit ribosomal protein L9